MLTFSPQTAVRQCRSYRLIVSSAIGTLAIGSCSGPTELPKPTLAAAVVSGDFQTGPVAAQLTLPLQVRVTSNGEPVESLLVDWHAERGALLPGRSLTNAAGIAETRWKVGTMAGIEKGFVSLEGSTKHAATFSANVLPGEAAAMQVSPRDQLPLRPDDPPFWLSARVTDLYGNACCAGRPVDWTVDHEFVAFISADSVVQDGSVNAHVRLTGSSGTAVVSATLRGKPLSAHFTVTVDSLADRVVYLEWLDYEGLEFAFTSRHNGSSPAIDTTRSGRGVTWTMYDETDAVISVGAPSFQVEKSGRYSRATFTAPGTYHYRDGRDSTATGTVVVQ
jgi:plastocyanin